MSLSFLLYTGPPTLPCGEVQDVYFVVDATSSNDMNPFCQEMYALQLLSAAINPNNKLYSQTSRIGSYLYPKLESSSESDLYFLNITNQNCTRNVLRFHQLIRAFRNCRLVSLKLCEKIQGLVTLPRPTIDLLASDIETEIASGIHHENRRRIIIILTDGTNDEKNETELANSVQRLATAGNNTIIIAAGILTDFNTMEKDHDNFKNNLVRLANGNENNAILVDATGWNIESVRRSAGLRLAKDLIDKLTTDEIHVICPNKGKRAVI